MVRWIVIAAALAVGLLLVAYDRRTDDSGIEAGVLLLSAFAFTLAAPRAALAVALAVGLPMALLNGSVPGLLFSGIGAGLGYAARRSAGATRPG